LWYQIIYSFRSLNWFYDLFYVNGVKVISLEIFIYFISLSLAYLISDDGGWVSGSKILIIIVNAFNLEEV
jgi:hypothetical protein